jgi:hypothetical protein
MRFVKIFEFPDVVFQEPNAGLVFAYHTRAIDSSSNVGVYSEIDGNYRTDMFRILKSLFLEIKANLPTSSIVF